MTGWPGTEFLLNFLRLHDGDVDACMAVDFILEREDSLLAEINRANYLIRTAFDYKKRSVGRRLWLRDDLACILYGRGVLHDRDTLAYVTTRVHSIIEMVIEGRPANSTQLALWATQDPVRGPAVRKKVVEYILIESRLKGLVGKICKIIRGKGKS